MKSKFFIKVETELLLKIVYILLHAVSYNVETKNKLNINRDMSRIKNYREIIKILMHKFNEKHFCFWIYKKIITNMILKKTANEQDKAIVDIVNPSVTS